MPTCDIAIIGAGPYGLSAAAHFRASTQLDVKVFGETMSFWERMPKGMLLRSPWEGSHLSDPKRMLTLNAYRVASDNHLAPPVSLERFVRYGHWFQQQAVPNVDSRNVIGLEKRSATFQLLLQDGECWNARRVIVAAGIAAFPWRPDEFASLPPAFVSHTSEHKDLSRFAGQRILVIGAGQSALESAALLRESGAEVELLVRNPMVRWLWRHPWLHSNLFAALLYSPFDVGPAGISHLIARPDLYRRFPRKLQDRLSTRSIRPAGSAWLKPRLDGLPITTGCRVVSATAAHHQLITKLSDGSHRTVDHVLLGTGYRVDISRYSFIDRNLLLSIREVHGYPCLNDGFESSVAGLHFIGAPAAWSFGPLMRFVAGTEFAARRLARRILGKAADCSERIEEILCPDAA